MEGVTMERERIEQAVRAASSYDFGDSASALFEVDRLINESYADTEARSWLEQELAGILESGTSLAAKQEACRRLWRIGTDASLDHLGKMLGHDDPRVVSAACYAIGRRPSKRADELLRAALRAAPDPCRAPIEHLIEDRV
jgi:hypothetical protein